MANSEERFDETAETGARQRENVALLNTPLTLWNHTFGDLRGYLALFTAERHLGSKELYDVETTYYVWPEEASAAVAQALVEAKGGREVYYCAHLLTEEKRVKAAAAPILDLWADGDGAKVAEHLPEPTAVVESSPGREHFYWRLSHPVAPEKAEELNKRLAYAMGADKSGWDLGQLLRVPGTRNFKYLDQPVVTIKEVKEMEELKDAG